MNILDMHKGKVSNLIEYLGRHDMLTEMINISHYFIDKKSTKSDKLMTLQVTSVQTNIFLVYNRYWKH